MKIDDCQRTLALVSASTSVGTMTVHVPDMLMRANRRQYTQCRAYDLRVQVASTGTATTKQFDIYTLSNAWWVKASIQYAKAIYLRSTADERAAMGDRKAKWGDFIISCGLGAAGNFSNLQQYVPASSGDDMTASEVATDETLVENVRTGTSLEADDGSAMGFTVLAEDVSGAGEFNIFNEYLLTRQHVSPQDTRAAGYELLHDLDDVAAGSLKSDGDQAPWDLDAYPSPFVLADTIGVDDDPAHATRNISKTITAPLGIVLIKKLSVADAEVNFVAADLFLVHARKGGYKGVHAPAYQPARLG